MLGQAVGDAIGLSWEGLPPGRIARMRGSRPLRHALVFRRGLCSDDTEHLCMTAAALVRSGGDSRRFARALAWQLRGWFCSLPAGMGLATARACIKLCMGLPVKHAGVRSAGNGPAMRAAILGAVWCDDAARMQAHVDASTRLTHTDERALEGACVIARAAALSMRPDGDRQRTSGECIDHLLRDVKGEELRRHLQIAGQLLARNADVSELLSGLGLRRGVTGYINHTAPVAIFCWLKHRSDMRAALTAAVEAGGDTDTVGAIVGALVGAGVGLQGVPQDWLEGVVEWPRTKGYMHRLAGRLVEPSTQPSRPERFFWPGLLPRNMFFLVIVLLHGFRRLLPPY